MSQGYGAIYEQATRLSNPIKVCNVFIETVLHQQNNQETQGLQFKFKNML